MAKFILTAVAFCIGSTDAAVKPWEEMALGAAVGFVSDDFAFLACGFEMASLFSGPGSLPQAGKDLIHGLKEFNVTEIEAAVQEIQKAINEIPQAEAKCKLVMHDVGAIISVIKQYQGPEDAINHIVDNLFNDGQKIFEELSQMEYYGTDYVNAGMQLGMAIRRMLVGESAPNPPNATTPPPTPAPAGTWKLLAVGVAVGFVSDDFAFLACGFEMASLFSGPGSLPQAGKDLIHGLKEFNVTEIEAAITEMQKAIKEIPQAEAKCKLVMHDVEATLAVIKQYHGPKDAIAHIVDNLFNDGQKIFKELSQFEYYGTDYINAGVQLGMAFRRMLVGEAAPPPSPSTRGFSMSGSQIVV